MHAFKNLSNLRELILSHNLLTVIGKSSLGPAVFRIETLILDNNKIITIDTNAFVNMTRLADLALNGNKLTAVPQAVKKLPKLKHLNLGANMISELPDYYFSSFEVK